MTYVPRFGMCGFCGHFVDQHQGESFRVLEGPDDDRGWRYRCSCGCRIKYVIGADGGKVLVSAGDAA